MRVANGVFLAVFLLSAAVQFNDPDPLFWIFSYGVAALFTALALAGIRTWFVALAALAFYAGSAYYLPGWGLDTLLLLKEPKMSSIEVELAREAFGLLLCAVWMTVLTWDCYRSARKQTAPAAQLTIH